MTALSDKAIEAIMRGQESLKQQTVSIRYAALGDDHNDGRDTEEIVRALREERERLVARVERLESALNGVGGWDVQGYALSENYDDVHGKGAWRDLLGDAYG